MTDLELLDYTMKLYDPAQVGFWDHLFEDPECYCAVKYVPGGSIVVFRGSVTMLDWYNDLDEDLMTDPQLGPVHRGFFVGVRDRYRQIMSACIGKLYVTGHGLGAARSFLFGGLCIANGPMPETILGFGCPRPGAKQLSALIATHGESRWYRNRTDPVTFVPWKLGAYVHCGEKRQLDAASEEGDSWGPLADHHVSLYRAGLVSAQTGV